MRLVSRKTQWYAEAGMLRARKGTTTLAVLFVISGITGWAARFDRPSADSLPECVLAQRWVADNRDNLPTTASELYWYSPALKKATYAALSPRAQESIWREHFAAVLGSGTLNAGQRDVVIEWVKRLAEFYDPSAPLEVRRARIASMSEMVGGHFDPATRRLVFTLAGVGRHEELKPASLTMAGAPVFLTVTRKAMFFGCECQVQGEFDCLPLLACVPFQQTGCHPTEQGCGEGGVVACDGDCRG